MGVRIAGVCYIKADGAQLTIEGGVETNIAPTKKETVMGLAQVAGYKEVFQRPFLKVTALNTPDFPRSLLAAGTNMTITAELANGNVYYLSGAWMEGEPSIAAVEGTIALEFSGIQGSYAS